jgi:hypothetical protein
MSAWAKVHWDYNLARVNENIILANQYKDDDFEAARPRDQTYVVELFIRRDAMSHANFVSLGTSMNVTSFGSAFANKIVDVASFGLSSRVTNPITWVDTSTATSTCSPGSSRINVLITLTPMGSLGFGDIDMWLSSKGKFENDGFENFLRKYFADKFYKIEGGKNLKTFRIRA